MCVFREILIKYKINICVIQESDQTPHGKKKESQTAAGVKKCSEIKQNGHPSALICVEDVSSNAMPKGGAKELRKRKDDCFQAKDGNPFYGAKKAKTSKNDNTELAKCQYVQHTHRHKK